MKRIINTIIILFAAVTMMAQTSFVVTDKNGNSQLVQSLIFQQEAANDLFSWKTDGEADGYQAERDIRNLLFIARAKDELATGTSEEVTSILENLSGTDQADATAIAAALQDNPNVDEAYSADGDNVIIRVNNGSDHHTIYPMNDLMPSFSDNDISEKALEHIFANTLAPSLASNRAVYNGNVAIFNFFRGNENYALQNKLVDAIYELFDSNHYNVEMYENENFTIANLDKVIDDSNNNKYHKYTAIIIMSHGCLVDRGNLWREAYSEFLTGEECAENDLSCDRFYDKKTQKYYKTHRGGLYPSKECILYLGSCYSASWGESTWGSNADNPYTQKVEKDNLKVIAWEGKNSIAQAHAAILFSRMLNNGQTLKDALANSFQFDPINSETKLFVSTSIEYHSSGNTTLDCLADNIPQYLEDASIQLLSTTKDTYVKKVEGVGVNLSLKGAINGNNNIKSAILVSLDPVCGVGKVPLENHPWWPFYVYTENGQKYFSGSLPLGYYGEGLYAIKCYTISSHQEIQIENPCYIVYSRRFNDNYSLPNLSEADVATPTILGSTGQSTEEFSLTAGSSKAFTVSGYSGHSFKAVSLEENIARVSVNGTTLIATGVAEGTTYIGVYDEQNKQMAIAKVTVEAGGDVNISEGLVAYYPFNGNANDESGNGNHGRIIGNVELTSDRYGNANSAYRFFGQPLNYISVPDDESLHCSTFTLSAWVYSDAEEYGRGYLINKGRDINNGSYRLYVRGIGASNYYGGSNDACIEDYPTTGIWHMVTGTVEGNIAKFYLDGVLMDERTLTYQFSYDNSEPLTLGMHYYTGVPSYWAYPLLGILDEVRIYNRALSASEIKELYNN